MTALTSGRYRTEARLGSGGMGFVSRVYDQATGKHVALKRLLKGASSQHVALFQREFYTLASLHHPHIIAVYDYGVDTEGPYYTMELLVGKDLSGAAPMPWRDVCRCLREVASTLCLLHARRLLHRDLSPRNLWQTEDGTIKLLDFGALSSFGTAKDVAGTPPFVPPEALYGQPMDQRADLYMLGALGYWLVTGAHAYPAHRLTELPDVWRRAPAPASIQMRGLVDAGAAPVPAELDALLDALLSHNPIGRPVDCAELIDRLDSVAGFERTASEVTSHVYLQSSAFVGRAHEQELLRVALEAARGGQGSSTVLQSAAGLGRTRLLEELALQTRLSGATLLHATAGAQEGANALAVSLALKLLDALPEQARAAAQPFASPLSRLSPQLQQRIEPAGVAPARRSMVAGEDALRSHTALTDWFLGIACEQLIVLLVDDVHLADEPSCALLATLAGAVERHQLVLVTAHPSSVDLSGRAGLRALRQFSSIRELKPLSKQDTTELLHSVFGQALHLGRLAERLHASAQGNPAYCMEIAEHLVRTEVVRLEAGMWLIPSELSEGALPATRAAAVQLRLDQLAPAARRLGQVLGLRGGMLPLDACLALSEAGTEETFPLLEALCLQGVLIGSADGYRFTHETLREQLLAELEPERLRAAHARLGELLSARTDSAPVERMHAGLHLLLGGHRARGESLMTRAAFTLVTSEPHNLAAVVPALEQLTALLRAEGRSARELLVPLSALAAAAYFADRRLAQRYASLTIEQLEQALGLALTRRLRPWLGRKLGLLVALASAALAFRRLKRNPLVPSFREAMQLLFTAVGSLTGLYTTCLDPAQAKRCVQVLEPFAVLRPSHPASIYYAACASVAATARDETGKTLELIQGVLERVQGDRPIAHNMEEQTRRVRATMFYVWGILECWRASSRALELADRLDGFNMKLYELNADQVRTTYYAYEGNAALFERYRQRVEMHAIARGSAWQVEIWTAATSVMLYLRTHDAVGMKRSIEQLQRLSPELSSLNVYVRRARGAYLLLREKYAEAAACLEPCSSDEPRGVAGWGSEHAALARAYNGLGEHRRAREVCRSALERLTPLDLTFVGMNLPLQIEHALADAGLGDVASAAQQVDDLLVLHGSQASPLTLGALHEARTRIALAAGDDAAHREHLQKMESWYRSTGVPSVIQHCQPLLRANARFSARPVRSAGSDSAELDRVLSDAVSLHECSERALEAFARASPTLQLYVFLNEPEGPRLTVQVGMAAPSPELVDAVGQRLKQAESMLGTTEIVDPAGAPPESPGLIVDQNEHRLTLLHAWDDDTEVVVAAAVTPSAAGGSLVPTELLQVLAGHLHRTMRMQAKARERQRSSRPAAP